MRIYTKIRSLTVALTLMMSAACFTNSSRPRGRVEYVIREPPRERVEVISAGPGNGYVWVKGHWAWRRDDYEWIGGHWAQPERGYREWEPGRWEHERSGWYFVEGHWR
ncbi:MAG: YXWGXW repeat-containing protein [bacterium]